MDNTLYALSFTSEQSDLSVRALNFIHGVEKYADERPKIDKVIELVRDTQGPVSLTHSQIYILDVAYLALQGEIEELAGWKASADLRRQFDELHTLIDAPFN
ncbi:hypothetical protein [Microvirga massiliensis]|uniref:hypothetical protein n=1 Tax=Microvirga massiliensis TaxID=1033741 RepID=UPI00062B8262|nr:hypothetical protein [Microvirga massiliensis]